MDNKKQKFIRSQAMDLGSDYINRKIERSDFEVKLKELADKIPYDFDWFNGIFLMSVKLHDTRHLLVELFSLTDTDKTKSITQRVFDERNIFVNDEIEYYAKQISKGMKKGVIIKQTLLSE